MHIQNLILEITRRCNMVCKHCLRGDAQNLDMSKEIVDELLKRCDYIDSVTFTGGEPSLNIPLIRYFFEKAEEFEKLPESFFVITNGKVNQLELATEFLKWYPKMEYQEDCGIALSIDPYHDTENLEPAYVRGLSFYSDEKELGFWEKHPEKHILAEGRAANWGKSPEKPFAKIDYDTDEIMTLYVTANGKLLGNCDFSYEHIDDLSEYDIWHFDEMIETLKKENEVKNV